MCVRILDRERQRVRQSSVSAPSTPITEPTYGATPAKKKRKHSRQPDADADGDVGKSSSSGAGDCEVTPPLRKRARRKRANSVEDDDAELNLSDPLALMDSKKVLRIRHSFDISKAIEDSIAMQAQSDANKPVFVRKKDLMTITGGQQGKKHAEPQPDDGEDDAIESGVSAPKRARKSRKEKKSISVENEGDSLRATRAEEVSSALTVAAAAASGRSTGRRKRKKKRSSGDGDDYFYGHIESESENEQSEVSCCVCFLLCNAAVSRVLHVILLTRPR